MKSPMEMTSELFEIRSKHHGPDAFWRFEALLTEWRDAIEKGTMVSLAEQLTATLNEGFRQELKKCKEQGRIPESLVMKFTVE